MDAVRLDDVVVRDPLGRRSILGPVSLRVGRDERWALLGANGSGKTTLLTVAGAIRLPSAGTAEVLGHRLGRVDVRTLRTSIGYVGHTISERLQPGIEVVDAVLTGLRSTLVGWMQRFDDDDRSRAVGILDRFGCGHLAGRSLATCSQGERQRVMLARALVRGPSLLLLDEPAAGLDIPSRESLVGALEDREALDGIPSILATHHVEEIPGTTTHVGLLRSGRLLASGTASAVLADDPLTECFGVPLRVARNGDRWSVVADR